MSFITNKPSSKLSSTAVETGKKKNADSILREADDLLQSLASEEGLCALDEGVGGANDAIAWSSDLQSVLSKLDMLDSSATGSNTVENENHQ